MPESRRQQPTHFPRTFPSLLAELSGGEHRRQQRTTCAIGCRWLSRLVRARVLQPTNHSAADPCSDMQEQQTGERSKTAYMTSTYSTCPVGSMGSLSPSLPHMATINAACHVRATPWMSVASCWSRLIINLVLSSVYSPIHTGFMGTEDAREYS